MRIKGDAKRISRYFANNPPIWKKKKSKFSNSSCEQIDIMSHVGKVNISFHLPGQSRDDPMSTQNIDEQLIEDFFFEKMYFIRQKKIEKLQMRVRK